MPAPFGDAGMRFRDHICDADCLALTFDRSQCGVDDGDGHVAVTCRELVRFSAAAAFREQIELDAKHVALRHRELFPFGVAVLAALDEERRSLMQFGWSVPGPEIDLVVHQPL